MKFVIGMKVEMDFNEEMDTELDIKSLFRNGDVKLGEMQFYMLDEDGNNVMDEEGHNEAAEAIMTAFMGETKA